jgi:plasmid stabilization system protein ParE
VTRLALAPRALADIERLAEFLEERDPDSAAETGGLLLKGLAILKDHPLIGRKVEEEFRELVISRGRTGYIALYEYEVARDTALVLAIRHQRELPE